MELDIRVNLLENTAIILSKKNLNKEDIINLIIAYFDTDKVEVTNIKNSRDTHVVMTRQFIIYWLIEILDTPSKEIKKVLGYEEKSNIITTTLHKLKDLLFDQKDDKYVRPYNNLARLFAGFGIKIELITK